MGGSSPALKGLFLLAATASLALSFVACGGTVRTDGTTEDPETQPKDPEDPEDPEDDPSGGGGKSGGGPVVDLPECKLGVKRDAAKSCVFLYEERCYEEKLDACGCACKKQSGTVCSSGFPQKDVPTEVTCF